MSERMTTVSFPAIRCGHSEHGRKTPAEMIATLRRFAEHDKAQAEQILAASDEDFVVTTHTGVLTHRNVEQLWPPDVSDQERSPENGGQESAETRPDTHEPPQSGVRASDHYKDH